MNVANKRILRSRLLEKAGVRHGFTTRLKGTSLGPYASLNLHRRVGDQPNHVEQNLALVAKEAGFSLSSLCEVFQIHGNRVVSLSSAQQDVQEADGMVTKESLVLAIKIADCVPILLADRQGRVAALHAGWRGTVKDIVGAGVSSLLAFGASPKELFAALGPSIGPCCFFVTQEVAIPFQDLVPESVFQDNASTYRVDLWKANRVLLERAGIPRDHIDENPPCTSCYSEYFFSHRRDQGSSGRHLAFIQGGMGIRNNEPG